MTAPVREASARACRDASPPAETDASSSASRIAPGPRPDPTSDSRFTWGLVLDVFDVLERHGYRRAGNGAVGRAFGLLYPLTHAYEGTDAVAGTVVTITALATAAIAIATARAIPPPPVTDPGQEPAQASTAKESTS